MKFIRTILIFSLLSLSFSMLAQTRNPVHWVVGVSAGSEYLYPNTETYPIGSTFGIFQQFSIRSFSVSAGIIFGQREIYDKLINDVSFSGFSYTDIRIRKYDERTLSPDLFIKYYPSFLQTRKLFFLGLGVQIKNPTWAMGESTTSRGLGSSSNNTFPIRRAKSRRGYSIGIGMDYYMSERIFVSCKLGWSFFGDQKDSPIIPENLTYSGGNDNLFLEIQIGYNFKKSSSLYRG